MRFAPRSFLHFSLGLFALLVSPGLRSLVSVAFCDDDPANRFRFSGAPQRNPARRDDAVLDLTARYDFQSDPRSQHPDAMDFQNPELTGSKTIWDLYGTYWTAMGMDSTDAPLVSNFEASMAYLNSASSSLNEREKLAVLSMIGGRLLQGY